MADTRADLPRVLVIGAGFGGLACAFELAAAGYRVHVLEARDRVGGRIHSLHDFVGGKHVEAGGELLGSNHAHVMAYAAKFGLEFLSMTDNEGISPMILNGEKLLPDDVEKITAEIETVQALLANEARDVDADEPWKTRDAKTLDQKSTAEWIAGLEISPLAKKLLDVQMTGTNGVPTSRQSHLGNLTQVKGGGLERYWTDTEVFRLSGGNQQIATRLAKELGDRVTLNCPVKKISATGSTMTVVDAEGREHVADDVVLAIPPTLWATIEFSPSLPPALKPQVGDNVKFLAAVKGPFWKDSDLPPTATTDKDITQVWLGTDGQGAEGEQVLIAFTGGPSAVSVHERKEQDVEPEYIKSFSALYPDFEANFAKGKLVDWIGDPWSRGGYSFPAPGEVTTIGPILRKGIGHLHFAGEHACYQFVGYAEGALHAGVALAKRLARRDGV